VLNDRTVLITGAAGGLGSVIAKNMASHGARLALLDLQEDRLMEVAASLGRPTPWYKAVNLLDKEAISTSVTEAHEALGSIDVVVHTVGGFAMGSPVHDTSESDWEKMFNLNLWSSIGMAEAAVPRLKNSKRGGRLIFVSARAAMQGTASMGAYCASKGALIRVIESMASELLHDDVTVNCVLPSIIDTPNNREAMPDADPNKWVSPASLGEVISFLASDGARDISGAAIPVYGKS
jgi:NAD(P)-dependent dehydrogenase (short-subunit alcohol dehydrogenase family)